MGLDMYLRARKYLGDWPSSSADDRDRFWAAVGAGDFDEGVICEEFPSVHVYACVLYWHKSYAVDSWFSRECNDGEFASDPIYVSRDKLAELMKLCRLVAETEDVELAKEKLPIDDALVRLGVKYDTYYWDELKRTAGRIEALLNNPSLKDATFYYDASC